jgi:hypothetical protein
VKGTIEARICETFIALNQMAASLALIERACRQVLDEMPVGDGAAIDNVLALRAATVYAQMTLERTGDVSATLTSVAKYIGQLPKDPDASSRTRGAGVDAGDESRLGPDPVVAGSGPLRDRGQLVPG